MPVCSVFLIESATTDIITIAYTSFPTRRSSDLATAYTCLWRMLRVTRGVVPYAPAMPLGILPLLIPTPEVLLPLASWEPLGLDTVGDLYQGGFMIPFDDIRRDYGVPGGHFFSL